MKNQKKLSKLIALAVLFGGVTYGSRVWANTVHIDPSAADKLNEVSNNSVVIGKHLDGPADDKFAYAYNGTTAAETASWSLSGTDVWGDVFGGHSEAANVTVSGNTVTISCDSFSAWEIIGGYSSQGDVNNNKITISDGTLTLNELGGSYIYGGISNEGVATGNSVEINGTAFIKNIDYIYGGYSDECDVNNNKITISGGTLEGKDDSSISGGCTYGNMAVTGNSVEISGGTTKITNIKYIDGGYSAYCDVNNNKITISGGTLEGTDGSSISGGRVGEPSGDATGAATGNSVEISGTAQIKYFGIYGGFSGVSDECDVNNNKITISGGTLDYCCGISGGYTCGGAATGNSVEISGTAYIRNTDCIRGGYSFTGSANNQITISGGTLERKDGISICGGESYGSETAKGNKVTISGGTFSGLKIGIYGGSASNSDHPVQNNTVTINGGTFTGQRVEIIGGIGKALKSDNTVIINGGTFVGHTYVYGGGGNSKNNTAAILGGKLQGKVNVYGGSATNNTVIIGDKVQWVKNPDNDEYFNLYGGYSESGTGTDKDNTLIVEGKNITVTSVQYFDTYLFRVPAGIDNTTPMLSTTTEKTLVDTDKIKVTADQSTPATVILANNVKGSVSGNVTYDMSAGNIISGGGVSISSNQLIYTKGNISQWTDVQPGTLTGNTVTVNGGTDGTVATVNGGTQTFTAGDSGKTKWQNVYGGYSGVNGAVTTNNTVGVSGTATVGGNVYGGYSDIGNAISNTVNISGTATVEGDAYGGYSTSGNVADSTVNIQGGEIEGNVYGGYSATGNVTDNTVNIEGGEIEGNVYGGKSDNASATVIRNAINWTAGTVKGSEIKANNINITGTAAQYLGTTGTVTADAAAVLGDGTNTAIFTVGNGTDASALTFASGLDLKESSTLNIAASSIVTLQGTNILYGTVSGAGRVIVDGQTFAKTNTFTQTGGIDVINGSSILTLTAGILSKDVTNVGTVKLDGATLGGAYVKTGTLEFAKDIATNADYVAAETNKVDSGVTLTLTEGTLNKAVTNSGTVKVNATVGSGTVTVAQNINGGTLNVVSGLMTYTGTDVIGSTTAVKSGAKLDPAANLLNEDTTVESGGELYISTGTLSVDIKGEGTTYIKDWGNPSTSQIITVNSDRSIAGTLNGSGNTVDMTGDSVCKTMTIGTLADTTNLKIDVDMSTFTADKLSVEAVRGTPVVNLTNINVTADYDFSGGIELPKSESNKVTYVDGAGASGITYNITQSPSVITADAIVYTGNYKYTFTKGTAGTLSYKVEGAAVTFEKLVKGELASGTLSLTDDFVNGVAAGDITQGTKTLITVNLNGHNLTSTNNSDIVVGTNKTFNLNGGSTIAGTTDDKTNFSVAGTLAISGKTIMAGVISGAGTVTNSGILTIEDASKIQVTGTNGLENTGTINLGGTSASILGGKISGGTLNINGDVTANAGYIAGATNTIAENKTLTLTDGTLGGTLSGVGNVVIGDGTEQTVKATVAQFNNSGTLSVSESGTLELTDGNLAKAVTNEGTVKLNGATLGGKYVTVGTLEFAKNVSVDVSYVAAPTNIVDSGVTLTLTGENKTLGQKVSGAGKVVVDGISRADADKFTQTGGLEVQNTLAFTSRGLDVAAVGGFTQAEDSNVVVPITEIKSDANTAENALFKNVTNMNQLEVKNGNLIVLGQVTDGQYYVLVEGTAVADKDLTAADLWKKENIVLDTSKYFLADYDYVTDGNAIAVKVQAAISEEVNTPGLVAVQQGNITVAKEFTGEVENHLGMIANPKLAEKEKYDKEIWASYIRTKETTEGMKIGAGMEGNNTAQYNGAVVGVDFYSSRKAVAGLALSYTVGDIDSQSNGTFTRNKSKYYGVSFYDRVTNGNTALIYDIGYIRGDNDINQYYNGKETTADVKTDTYTAGVRYEAEFGTEKSRVVPFASFRYMRQNNKDYTNSHGTRFEAKNQNLYIPKVGIAWTGDFAMPQCEWTWRPSVEAGYVWNLVDRSVDSNVFVGTSVAPIEYDTVDKSSYYARAGMEFMCKNFTAGVFYRYLKGDAVRNNKWNFNMAWSF